jgi:glutamyl-tRNA reductase
MNIQVTGLNHQTAPVGVREALAFPAARLAEALAALAATQGVGEGVILSTCNRVEVYTASAEPAPAGLVPGFLASFHGAWPETFQAHLFRHEGREAVRHLFRVACGLDSMVVGEAQVTGQVRAAYDAALDAGTAGRVLHRLFQQALAVAKRVRTETEIGAGRASVGSVAVELAQRIFESLAGKTVLVIGAGEMGASVVASLRAAGAAATLVANRTYERAVELAAAFGGRAVPFDALGDHLAQADIVISSTDAPHYVLTRARVEAALARRRGRPLFLVDIAVPRDIEPAAGGLEGCYLYDIDDLQAVVAETLAQRQQEIGRCEATVEEECGEFMAWLGRLAVAPTIAELAAQLHDLKRTELDALLQRLPELSPEGRAEIERMADRLVNKILHQPIRALREAPADGRPDGLLGATLRLFGLRRGTGEPSRSEPR